MLAYNPAVQFRYANLVLIMLLVTTTAVAQPREFPTNRSELKGGDWFPYVLSKLAPLEWWSFAVSLDDIRRVDYSSDFTYNLAKQNTWEFPRLCFSFFRPNPEVFATLLPVLDEYKGEVFWVMHDDCIAAMAGKPTFYTSLANAPTPNQIAEFEHLARNPPQADPEFVKKAMADLPRFCAWLENRLGLKDKPPLLFDPQWVTREGLATSPGPFEDFVEPGAWMVVLTPDPQRLAAPQSTVSPKDRPLGFGMGMFESDALVADLGANWETYQANGGQGPILPQYPLLSRLGDMTEDAVYAPAEVDSFLAECVRAQQQAKDPHSIRGLDKLIRIARWAQKLELGIYFGGQ